MSEYVSDPVSSEEEVVAVEEPAPVEEPVAVAVEEVSTETVDNSNQNELEERVKVLEERLKKIIITIKSYSPKMEKELIMIL